MRNLHVLWLKPKKDKPPPLVRDIVKLHVDKVMKESSTLEDIVVFYGYDSSSKDHCRLLRSPIRGLQNDLDWNTPVTTQQPVFLSNTDNKSAFIGSLGDALDDTGIEVVRCRADADVMIVQTAFTEALRGKSVRLWSDDTDLMVILLHLIHSHADSTDTCTCKIHMFRPSTRTTVDLYPHCQRQLLHEQ